MTEKPVLFGLKPVLEFSVICSQLNSFKSEKNVDHILRESIKF
jgi:hypothetical protein